MVAVDEEHVLQIDLRDLVAADEEDTFVARWSTGSWGTCLPATAIRTWRTW